MAEDRVLDQEVPQNRIGKGADNNNCQPLNDQHQLFRHAVFAPALHAPTQDEQYRKRVLPPQIRARVTVEAGSVIGWDRYAGASGAIIGMRSFGASAPFKDVLKKFGFTPENVLAAAKAQIAASKHQ